MMGEKILPASYQEMEHTWVKEQHTEWYTRYERNAIEWVKSGIW
jgi:hypothetical protein